MKWCIPAIALWLLCFPARLLAGDYDKAWTALLKNDQQKAAELFRSAVKSNDNKDNAISMLIILEGYHGVDYAEKYPAPLTQMENADPYLYALWFTEPMMGQYSKKKGKQLAAMNDLVSNSKYHGSLRAAASYVKGMHYVFGGRFDSAHTEFKKAGALESWQFVGPFDNTCGSGFNKDYAPIKEPVSAKGFMSSNNNMVNWFSPLQFTNEAWVFVQPFYSQSSAVGYAQCFVNSPQEQDVVFCLGGYGALRAWVNDKLLVAEQEARRTELDAYLVKCHLNKGYNRVLVQIGYTAEVDAPNFIVRLTDAKFNAISDLTSSPKPQPYTPDASSAAPQPLTHFAEDFFLKRITQSPKDPANYMLLSKVYLRNQQYDKAKALMFDWYKKYPENPFIVNYYADCLSGQYESTQTAELVEKVKLLDPENYWVILIEENKLEGEKKFDEALVLVEKLEARNGRSLMLDLKRVSLMAQTGKIDSAIAMVRELYAKNLDNETLVNMMAQFNKHVLKDPAAAMTTLESFLAGNYSYSLTKMAAEEYFDKNDTEKGLAALKRIVASSPYDPNVYQPLVQHFFAKQQYDSAIHYLNIRAGISPYDDDPLADIASCYVQKNNKDKALEYYRKALSYYSGGFEYRRRIRELEKKPDIFKYFPEADFYDAIKESFKKPYDTAHAYYFILDERNVVVYSEGASEQIYSAAIQINNKNGIESWKEMSIPYNSYYQGVKILKAEVIKPNGSRVPADTEGSDIVFTKLEPGDAIYYSYKISNYGTGRLGKEFWDKFYFNSTMPSKEGRYNIMIANDLPLYYDMQNDNTIKPVEGKKENFRTYSWVVKDQGAIRDEPYMPNLEDVAKVLHVSTVKSWDVIAEWYSDLTRMQSREDFELNEAFKEIFPKGVEGLSDMEKAEKIYAFIEAHIEYSSVSFRQSEYVPQRAGKTLQTRLGDCKDVSTLFLTFARKAGLDANLMLVSTRDNGTRSVVLPSIDFNHCIVRFKAGNNYHFLELTDNKLPFNSLTRSLSNAQVLNIPYNYKAGEKIIQLPTEGRHKVVYDRNVKIKMNNSDLQVSTSLKCNGDLASSMRYSYLDKTKEESKDNLQESLAAYFKNQIVVNNYSFKDLENLKDTIEQSVDFTVKNDVISVGDFSMFKPVLLEQVATANIFTQEKRQFPFEYANYETVDRYNTVVEVELPAGKSFEQVPSDIQKTFMYMNYSLTFKKEGTNKLRITRLFDTDRTRQLSAADFTKMESFFNDIIAAEQKYISFK